MFRLFLLALLAVAFASDVKYVVVDKQAAAPPPPAAPLPPPPPPPPPPCTPCGNAGCCVDGESCRGIIFRRCGGSLFSRFNGGLDFLIKLVDATSSVADIIAAF